MQIAIFASGSGSNAETLVKFGKKSGAYEVSLIICNRKSAGIYERANNLGIKIIYFNKTMLEDQPDKLVEILHQHHIKFIVLAGFLCKIPPLLLQSFENKIVNIHPSLLPKYGGKGMYGAHVHKAVIEAGELESGITIHYVNENYDQGEHLLQAKVNLDEGETIESLAAKVQRLEHKMYPLVVEYLISTMVNSEK